MSDCNASDTVGCIRQSPNLAFGVFNNVLVFAAGAWLWFLSMRGAIQWTGSRGVMDFFYQIYSGLSSVVSSFGRSETTKDVAGFQAGLVMSDLPSRMVYIAVLIATISLGWYYRDSPVLGSLILGGALFSGVILHFGIFEIPLTLPVVGGLLMGIIVTVVIWLVQFFSLTPGNEFGSMIMILLVIWLMLTMLAWYGSRVNNRRRRTVRDGDDFDDTVIRRGPGRPKGSRSKKTIAAEYIKDQLAAKPPIQIGSYPVKDWVGGFQVSYDKLSESIQGRPASKAEIKTAYMRALPRLKKEYDATGGVDIDEVVIDVYI